MCSVYTPCSAITTLRGALGEFDFDFWRLFLLYFIGIYNFYINIIILYFYVFIKILPYFLNNRVSKPNYKKKKYIFLFNSNAPLHSYGSECSVPIQKQTNHVIVKSLPISIIITSFRI